MKYGSFELEIREKEGFNLLAPISYWEASEEEIEAHTGGCGPGKLGDKFVPDTMWGESVFLACQIHDWCYYKGETPEDKKVSDRVFLLNMVELIDDGEILDTLRLRRAMTYYQAVSMAGGDAFES